MAQPGSATAPAHERLIRDELRERLASWTNGLLNVLGVAMVVILVVRFAVDLSPAWTRRLNRASAEIWAIFVLDFLAQLLLATDKKRFLKHHWLLALSVVLPAFRVIHVVRMLVSLQDLGMMQGLAGLNSATETLGRMLRGHQFGRALVLTGVVTVVGAAGLTFFEGQGLHHFGDALWWSAAFVTTVGSDFQPRTLEGRILALLLVAWGLGVVGYVTAAIASYFVGEAGTPSTSTASTGAGGDTAGELQQLRQEVAELKTMLEQVLAQRQG